MELKTLKDFDWLNEEILLGLKQYHNNFIKDDLREEAIKWIKEFEKNKEAKNKFRKNTRFHKKTI